MSGLKRFFRKIFSFNTIREKGISVNKNILTFSIFLVLSASLWFLNALRKSYVTEINYPIHITNPPNGLVVGEVSSTSLLVTIKADGFTLASYYFSQYFRPLVIDVLASKSHIRRTQRGVYLLSNPLSRQLYDLLSKNVQILSIAPDTLFIDFSKEGRKKIPVKLVHSFTFEKQYNQSAPIIIQPDSVVISGSSSALSAIDSIETGFQNYHNIKDSLFLRCKLQFNSKLAVSEEFCNVIVPVEPFTEAKIKVPVVSKNLPENVNAKFFPSEISVSYNVAISRMKSITSHQFSAVVDFSLVSSSFQPDKMRVKIETHPPFINEVSYSPLLVDYILESKK